MFGDTAKTVISATSFARPRGLAAENGQIKPIRAEVEEF